MRIIISSVLFTLLVACSSGKQGPILESLQTHKLDNPLSTNTTVALSVPEDISFNKAVHKQSGHKTASAFKTEFENKGVAVSLLSNCQMNCLDEAKNMGSNYFVNLELLHWEERSTNWSGKADRLTIKVSVYDSPSGSLLTSSFLHTNTRIYSPSGGRVENFLPALSNQYVSSLF